MKNLSGTITTGGAWQQVSLNASRSWFDFQNISDTEMLIFQSYNGVAPPSTPFAGAIKVAPGAIFEAAKKETSGGVLHAYCVTTGKAFTSREIA